MATASTTGVAIGWVAGTKSGRHTRQWDGRNDAGQQVVSGVYIYRLQVGSLRPGSGRTFMKTMKMTLIK